MDAIATTWTFLLEQVLTLLSPLGITESVLQFMLISAMLGLSIYLTLYTGMFSLANAGFMAIGAYVAVIMTQEYDFALWVAIVSGTLVAGLIAIPIGWPVLRLKDIYLAIATIGFSEVVRITILNFDNLLSSFLSCRPMIDLTRWQSLFLMCDPDAERVRLRIVQGARGIKGIPKLTETWMLVLFLLIVIFLLIRLHRSRFGRAMAAIRQDEQAAANMGINVVYVKNVAFILSAMLAGAAGAFNGHLTRIITPNAFDFNLTVDILAYAVLGGTQSWLGPVVGGFVLTALPETLRFVNEYRGLFNGLILLAVIVYLPGGLVNIEAFRKFWYDLRQRGTDEKAVP
jgi:branched-chain amino acid transport system permease protein